MRKNNSILNENNSTEYDSEYKDSFQALVKKYYNKVAKPRYKDPVIYSGKNHDLSKRWYVYFYYRETPDAPRMKRSRSFYFGINGQYKNKKDRLYHFRLLAQSIKEVLKQGYLPNGTGGQQPQYSAESLLDYALRLKKETVKFNTYDGYSTHVNMFKAFLKKRNLLNQSLKSVRKKDVNDFLRMKLNETSASNRNNIRRSLSAIFSTLLIDQEDNEYLNENIIDNIPKLKTTPKINKTYSKTQRDEILRHLEREDPILLLFIWMLSFNALRGVELCRIQIKDVDIESKLIYVETKNDGFVKKMIPQIVLQKLEEYFKMFPSKNGEDYLFTPNGIGPWGIKEATRRRGYFTRRFQKKVKAPLSLSREYTMYSFRHYFIGVLYEHLRKKFSKSKTEDYLMLYTGHTSRDGLFNYLRVIKAEKPEDFSSVFEEELDVEFELRM